MTIALYILGGILLVYLGYLIGIIHASIVALKENKKDREDLDQMTELLAKMTLTIENLLEKSNDVDKTDQ
jgi:hypothetical protein